MTTINWPHKFNNGLTLGSPVSYNYKGAWIVCRLQYALYFGTPTEISLIPFKSISDIGNGPGMRLVIEEKVLYDKNLIKTHE